MNPVPKKYYSETPMSLSAGVCGFKFQLNNKNKEFGFSFNVLKDGGFYALSASASLLVAALVFF